ncbi:CHAT domain-containing protein [Aspergillus similis]
MTLDMALDDLLAIREILEDLESSSEDEYSELPAYYRDLEPDEELDALFQDLDVSEIRELTETLGAERGEEDTDSCPAELRMASHAWYHLSRHTNNPADLRRSVDMAQQAVEAARSSDANPETLQKDAVVLLIMLYKLAGNLCDLEQAIDQAEILLVETPDGDTARVSRILGLSDLKKLKHQHTCSPADEADAIATTLAAMEVSRALEGCSIPLHARPAGVQSNTDGAWELTRRGLELRREFDQTRNLSTLGDAISKGREAVMLLPPHHPSRSAMLTNLVTSLLRKYEHTNSIDTLNEATSKAQEAVTAASPVHLHRAHAFGNLGNCLRFRFERTGDLSDLTMAIDAMRNSVIPDKGIHRAASLGNLSVLCWRRFERLNNAEDLKESIDCGTEAVNLMPRTYPYRPGALSNLAIALMRRFETYDELDDLNSAISRADEADSTSLDSHADKGLILGTLCTCLRVRSDRTGDLGDLNRAIKCGQRAVAVTGDTHFDKANRHDNYAVAHFRMFERRGNIWNLNQAIEEGQRAVNIIHAEGYHRIKNAATLLNNLGVGFKCRFEVTRNPEDLRKALELENESLQATPDGHPDIPMRYANLSGAHFRQFEFSRSAAALDKGVDYGQMAVDKTPDHHPSKTRNMNTLASCLFTRFQLSGELTDLLRGLSAVEEGATLVTSPPRERIQAALLAVSMSLVLGDTERLSRLSAAAVELLPSVSPRSLRQSDQQHMVGEFAGLASLAAAAALEANSGAARSVELLELGRGVIMGLLLGTRSDLSDLREVDPQKADRFERLRDELDTGIAQDAIMMQPPTSIAAKRDRHVVVREFDKVINEIQHIAGFQNFMAPSSHGELRNAASRGPIAIVNVSALGCHALIVKDEPDWIQALPLPLLKVRDIEQRVNEPLSLGMLKWLWDSVARPILEKLGFCNTPARGRWPRMWWVPTGQLTRLPLHAAGDHSANSSETVLDRVVSSYAPSIKALVYARQNAARVGLFDAPRTALLVSMPRTRGASDLICADREIQSLEDILPHRTMRKVLSQPLRKEVVKRLHTCTIFHFAGHGRSDPVDPSKSCLLLDDWETDPLTVEDLTRLKLYRSSPWLSYLSACSTGETEVKQLQDEAIHLVCACQLAGFPHVVGSLWEIDDEYCVHMSSEVYRTIAQTGWNDDAVALGVHNAVRALRQETSGSQWGPGYAVRIEGMPLIWAAYIHYGP